MVALDSLVYSVIQVVYNLNGVVALGVPLMWLWCRPQHTIVILREVGGNGIFRIDID